MNFPVVGHLAPNFRLLNQRSEMFELADFRGKSNVLVYFYPKALTPGCTSQSCGLRDYDKIFTAENLVVLGISPDAPKQLLKFDEKYALKFNLLSDPDHSVAEAYGVWQLKKFMGREYKGIVRTSFLIDLGGQLRHIIEKVNTKTHNEDVLSLLKSIK
jgi:thioredoxin-dependent peroxiredoxin